MSGREGPVPRGVARGKFPRRLLHMAVSVIVALLIAASSSGDASAVQYCVDLAPVSAYAPPGAAQAFALGQQGAVAAAGRMCMPLQSRVLLGRSAGAARPVPLLLQMQERSRQHRGGQQQRGRGGRRWGSRGGRGREGRDDIRDGDGGGMSTDYVRGAGATLKPDDRLDEKLNRFLQRELEDGEGWNFKPGRGSGGRGRGSGVFTPRGLGRSNFIDDDDYQGNVQRGRVCAAIAEPPLPILLASSARPT
jgi:hypothetical protein